VYCILGVTKGNYLVIRFNAEEPLKLRESIRFSYGEVGIQFLGGGWSYPESWGVWSDGSHASIVFSKLTAVPSSMQVEGHTVNTPLHPSQSVNISINGVPAGRFQMSSEATSSFTVVVPQIARKSIREMGVVRIDFGFPDAAQPRELGTSDDGRRLGIALRAITLY
jgi:hypothetical protein